MGLAEFIQSINIKEELIPVGKRNRPGRKMTPRNVTIHNTANADLGANAARHSLFVRETGHYIHRGKVHWISWHYTVDDREVIQQLPEREVAYHAGAEANSSSIAIEICMHRDNNQEEANERAARLAAFVLNHNGLGIAALRTHKSWTNKDCPVLLLAGDRWAQFVARVQQYIEMIKGPGLLGLDFATTPFEFQGCLDGEEEKE